uniref:Uncharacterized protein n=1 Tax=Picea glauca TaxID=3330 RepID=A0A117NGI0_PICGL|nr:hypothetical protein ABT39_MTgene6291 [Picea glauca]QHR87995.1 hypothetical protein Q903MT_gene2007 [Picea sitchensis]
MSRTISPSGRLMRSERVLALMEKAIIYIYAINTILVRTTSTTGLGTLQSRIIPFLRNASNSLCLVRTTSVSSYVSDNSSSSLASKYDWIDRLDV